MFQSTATKRAFSLTQRWPDRLPQVVDASLWSLVVLAPFVWGGRHDAARLLYALLVVAACTAWMAAAWIRQKTEWTSTPALAIPALAAMWLVVQLIPLPTTLVQWLSPHVANLLPLWYSDASSNLVGRHGWSTLSLNPAATRGALAMLICYALLFFVALERFRTLADVILLLRWMATAAVAMAVFGLLQYTTSNGLFFWVYDHPFRSTEHFVCGSFVNRNHFASFVAMGAAAICFTLATAEPQSSHKAGTRLPGAVTHRTSRAAMLWAIGLAVVLLALAMSFSRGGVAATGVGAVVMAVAYWQGKVWNARQLAGLLLAAVVLGAGLSLSADGRIADRLDDLTSGSLDELDRRGARRLIWSANLQAISHAWLTGSGAGTHRDIYPVYIAEAWPKTFTHAENSYLQVATETGLPGVLLLLAALGWVACWSIRAWRNASTRQARAAVGAVVAALAVSAAHNLVDFTWYIPATMTLVVLLSAALCRLAQLEQDAASAPRGLSISRRRMELAIVLGWGAVYALAVLTGPALASLAWSDYLRYSAVYDHGQQSAYDDLIESGDPTLLRDTAPRLEAKARALYRTTHANPSDAAAQVRLAQTLLQLFDARSNLRENQMVLAHLHAAVMTGGFQSPGAIRPWLTKAVGDDLELLDAAERHARRAVELSPLEGPVYVCLANVSFMHDPSGAQALAYLEQAAAVRPQDGHVLFEVGKHHLIAGDFATAMEYWQRCYRQPGEHRLLVVAALAGRIPAREFLDTFDPDWPTLRAVWQRYLAAGRREDLDVLLAHAAKHTEEYEAKPGATRVAYVWRWLANMHRDRGNADQELACLEQALADNPTLFAVRHDLALALYKAKRYAEAEPHLRWCLARRPENKGLRTALHQSYAAQSPRGSISSRRSSSHSLAR